VDLNRFADQGDGLSAERCLFNPHICTSPFWALLLMSISHGYLLLDQCFIDFDPVYDLAIILLGRAAYPLYLAGAFAAFNSMPSKKRKKYSLRLFWLGALSEYPYQIFFGHPYNVIFVILFCVLLGEALRQRDYLLGAIFLLMLFLLPPIFASSTLFYLSFVLISRLRYVGQGMALMAMGGPLSLAGLVYPLYPPTKIVGTWRIIYRYFYPLHLAFFACIKSNTVL